MPDFFFFSNMKPAVSVSFKRHNPIEHERSTSSDPCDGFSSPHKQILISVSFHSWSTLFTRGEWVSGGAGGGTALNKLLLYFIFFLYSVFGCMEAHCRSKNEKEKDEKLGML